MKLQMEREKERDYFVVLFNWYFKKMSTRSSLKKKIRKRKNTNVKFLLAHYKQRSTITKTKNQ